MADPAPSKRDREEDGEPKAAEHNDAENPHPPKLSKKEDSVYEANDLPPPKKRSLAEYQADISAMFKKNDLNGDGTIDKAEFEGLIWDIFRYIDPTLQPPKDGEDVETVRKLIDRNHDSAVSEEELFDSLKEWIPSIGGGKKALIIVDLQNDFVAEKGSMSAPGRMEAVRKTNKLREQFDFDVVALTRDWHPKDHSSFFSNHKDDKDLKLFDTKVLKLPDGTEVEQVMWPDHCLQGEWGAQFCEELVIKPTDLIVDKGTDKDVDSYSGFFDNCKQAETPLQRHLKMRDVGEVYVVGVAMDYCVGSTALDAACCGFSSYLVRDCSSAVAAESWKTMEEALQRHEVEVIDSSQEAARRLVRRRERTVERVNVGHNKKV